MAPIEAAAGKKACVVGGSGYVASLLIKLLLEKGYAVNATVRDPDNLKKIPHLLELQKSGELSIFRADLTDEESFNAPVKGCELVFHVATPINFASQDPENDMIKPAVLGVSNVMKASVKSKTVKRVVLTSSGAAACINTLQGTGLVVTEEDWSDVDFLYTAKPPAWGYSVSKTLAEKKAWELAREYGIELVTVIPTVMLGPSLAPDVPSSVALATCLLTRNEFLLKALKGMQMLSGSIAIAHVEDVCRAHVFLAEKPSASGRYICSAVNTSVPHLANFFAQRYPHYNVSTDFGDFPSKPKVVVSSEKLIKEGFSFKYGMEETFDKTVEYLKEVGVLPNNSN